MECAGLVVITTCGGRASAVLKADIDGEAMMLPGLRFALVAQSTGGTAFCSVVLLACFDHQVLGWAVAYFFSLLAITPIAIAGSQGMLQL